MQGNERTKYLLEFVKKGMYGEANVVDEFIQADKERRRLAMQANTDPAQMSFGVLQAELKRRGHVRFTDPAPSRRATRPRTQRFNPARAQPRLPLQAADGGDEAGSGAASDGRRGGGEA